MQQKLEIQINLFWGWVTHISWKWGSACWFACCFFHLHSFTKISSNFLRNDTHLREPANFSTCVLVVRFWTESLCNTGMMLGRSHNLLLLMLCALSGWKGRVSSSIFCQASFFHLISWKNRIKFIFSYFFLSVPKRLKSTASFTSKCHTIEILWDRRNGIQITAKLEPKHMFRFD